jgi:hypothetical protein
VPKHTQWPGPDARGGRPRRHGHLQATHFGHIRGHGRRPWAQKGPQCHLNSPTLVLADDPVVSSSAREEARADSHRLKPHSQRVRNMLNKEKQTTCERNAGHRGCVGCWCARARGVRWRLKLAAGEVWSQTFTAAITMALASR